jgi:Zn-dependent M28 family amino/carboxypeptidase
LAPETVIISAHHDHDGSSGPDIWHGADDNGSGTVGVVELARAFVANGTRPRRSILFTVFAAEERGLLVPITWRPIRCGRWPRRAR